MRAVEGRPPLAAVGDLCVVLLRGPAFLLLLLAACHVPSRSEVPRTSSSAYEADAMWLCRPDLPGDACHGDLTATELHADGTRTRVAHAPAAAPAVDCFYVYPTVDMDLYAGNHTDLADTRDMARAALVQVARFSEVCAVYAPLYRQASIGTYTASEEEEARYFEVASSDVRAAFDVYMRRFNQGRRVVIVGHSQGAQMVAMLLQRTMDRDEALRQKLLVAMPIGFYLDVPDGATQGGTFENIPVCTSDDQTGCVVAYRTLAAGDAPIAKLWPLRKGRRTICVDPAGAGPASKPRSRAFFPTRAVRGALGVDTPFVLLKDFYAGRCVADPGGRDYLEIAEARAPGDLRPSVIDLPQHHGFVGLHVADLQFMQGDLIDLIRKKLAAHPAPPGP